MTCIQPKIVFEYMYACMDAWMPECMHACLYVGMMVHACMNESCMHICRYVGMKDTWMDVGMLA